MKVLFVCSGNAINGISPIIKNQGESLNKVGVQIKYFPIQGKGLLSYLKHIRILRKHLSVNKYDIIHSHYSLSSLIATLAGSKPLVVSLMGSDTKAGFFNSTFIRFFSFFYWNTVIVKSESMRRDSGIKKAIIIPNGINLDKVKPLKINSNNDKTRTILFAANPERFSKNFDLAKKSLKLIQNTDINLKIVHSIPHQKMIEEINKASIILLTSRWEGSPNLVKEAMACNKPVVATRVGDIEWLFDNEPGYFITSFNPTDVAEKIQKALDFSNKYGRTKGRERIIKLGLDDKTIAQKLIDIYKTALKY